MTVADLATFASPILAIETSCDETAAAIVVGRSVRSNVIASQIDLHAQWGGVVPEAAARAHVEQMLPVIAAAMQEASVGWSDLGAIAVTNRPGLVGALSIGLTTGKGLAFALGIPLLAVHHLEGHLSSVYADSPDLPFPHVALVVSGGHTELVQVSAPGEYRVLGETRDDAAGEAFDKSARLLGLPYPGGRALMELAELGHDRAYDLPKTRLDDPFEFSFSGLKTAMWRLVQHHGDQLNRPDAAAALQRAVLDQLARGVTAALSETGAKGLALVGGVAANQPLRARLAELAARHAATFAVPPLSLCTDNAAMIGLAASWRLARGETDNFSAEALPNAPLPSIEMPVHPV
ncbi:MAG: tRNA (adenosine(37)-N6)-threonylcarbamoyltransferase complex transferase subunit TsaD [Fimbriimonadaceae bacterium]|nr:tRNA (adenosine(37)-N6)-threonylcarbamoyltransferase complex transferase subunit TsaD [Fimbriimonadaceae bacterium]